METVTLNNGIKMPILGLATMRVKKLHEVSPTVIQKMASKKDRRK